MTVFPQAHSQEQERLLFNAYYTLDASIADDDVRVTANKEGTPGTLEKSSVGFTNSLIGAQVEYRFTERFSAFVQGAGYLDANESLTGSIDWAYLSYDLADDFRVRGGKFQTPFMQGTELRQIGFTRLWVRNLIPESGVSGYNSFTGIELFKQITTENGNWQLQLSLGDPEHQLDEIDGQRLGMFAVRYNVDDFWVRAAVGHIDYSFAPARRTAIEDLTMTLVSLEAEWYWGNARFNAGLSSGSAYISPDDSVQYLSIAYPLGDWTPYIVTTQAKQAFNSSPPEGSRPAPDGGPGTLPGPGSPPGQGPPPGQEPGMGPPSPPQGDIDNERYALGVRWNVAARTAIKFQLEHSRTRDASREALGVRGGDANVLSVVVEGVF